MDKLATVLALAALGLGAYAAFGKPTTSTEAMPSTDTTVLERLDELTAQVDALRASRHAAPLQGEVTASGMSAPGLRGTGAEIADEATQPLPAEATSRIEAMAKELEATKERLAKVEETRDQPFSFGGSSMYMSVDQAAKALELDERQERDMQDIVASTQESLEALMKTPNEDGKTLEEVAPMNLILEEGEQPDIGKLMESMGKRASFMRGKVPGSNETYAQAAARIRKDGKSRARELLSADQAKTWDKANTGPLFGGGDFAGGGVVTSISTDMTPGGDG